MSYHKLPKDRVVYCDVDDTLVLWDYQKYSHTEDQLLNFSDEYGIWYLLPHTNNINFLTNLKRQGYGVVIWSAAGQEWAEKVVKALKLEDIADVILSKPELALDDLLDATRIVKSVVWIDPENGNYQRNK